MARNTNTIRSKGDYAQEEGYTTTAVTPGMLVEIDTAELVGLNDEAGVDVPMCLLLPSDAPKPVR